MINPREGETSLGFPSSSLLLLFSLFLLVLSSFYPFSSFLCFLRDTTRYNGRPGGKFNELYAFYRLRGKFEKREDSPVCKNM